MLDQYRNRFDSFFPRIIYTDVFDVNACKEFYVWNIEMALVLKNSIVVSGTPYDTPIKKSSLSDILYFLAWFNKSYDNPSVAMFEMFLTLLPIDPHKNMSNDWLGIN